MTRIGILPALKHILSGELRFGTLKYHQEEWVLTSSRFLILARIPFNVDFNAWGSIKDLLITQYHCLHHLTIQSLCNQGCRSFRPNGSPHLLCSQGNRFSWAFDFEKG